MAKKDKELLFKDLCSRLPYGVKVKLEYYDNAWNICSINPNGVTFVTKYTGYPIETYWENCKPYLFPLSSMTEEQWFNAPIVDLTKYTFESFKCGCFTLASYTSENNLHDLVEFINWLYKNHFDVNGLLPIGLAIDATGLNIY